MSLAMFAAPIDETENDMISQKKKQSHNKTQKRYEVSEKVNSVLATIHENMANMDENNLGDFNPPSHPQSAGVMKTKDKENAEKKIESFNTANNSTPTNQMNNMFRTLGRSPEGTNGQSMNSLELNNIQTNYADESMVQEYYNKFLPSMNNLVRKDTNTNMMDMRRQLDKARSMNYNNSGEVGSNDVLLQKINYMINLLEEQQDERTENVAEEVILYSFLGIFMIFLVDSFVRVGKYTR
jgi:hypothetical protein